MYIFHTKENDFIKLHPNTPEASVLYKMSMLYFVVKLTKHTIWKPLKM